MREQQSPLEPLLQQAVPEAFRRRIAALPAEEVLQKQYDFSSLDRRIRAALKRLRKERRVQAAPRGASLRTAKRIALVAALLAALLVGMLTVSAQLRVYVKEIIVEWTQRNVGIRYEVEGHQLTELPAGYGPHYIPAGFVYDTEESFADQSRFSFVYRNGQEKLLIDGCLSENASMVWTDNEHITFEWVTINGVQAHLGIFTERNGYTLNWAKDGIEHAIYFETNMPVSELYKIAENIY